MLPLFVSMLYGHVLTPAQQDGYIALPLFKNVSKSASLPLAPHALRPGCEGGDTCRHPDRGGLLAGATRVPPPPSSWARRLALGTIVEGILWCCHPMLMWNPQKQWK